jgi:hypothetical protein
VTPEMAVIGLIACVLPRAFLVHDDTPPLRVAALFDRVLHSLDRKIDQL